MKVYGQSNGYNYQIVPTIMLKGKWLEAIGFDVGANLSVKCEDGKLTIINIDRKMNLMEQN